MSEFEHLELPKTDIELPRRSGGGFGNRVSRSNRGSHGSKLQEQAVGLVQRPRRENSPFRLNPKLIFKLKLSQGGYLSEERLPSMGLTLLAQEPNANRPVVKYHLKSLKASLGGDFKDFCAKSLKALPRERFKDFLV